MAQAQFDFSTIIRPGLPPAAVKYTGFPPFNFVGGHNDAATTPVEALIAAAATVLRREGASLATYGLNSGPLGYIGLRQFLAKKLQKQAGITVTPGAVEAIKDAVDLHRQGLDFADARHWASARHCERFVTFDDRRFARKARRLGLSPAVTAPG